MQQAKLRMRSCNNWARPPFVDLRCYHFYFQAGDLAPFHVRVDGDTQDRARKGLYVLTGDVTSLEVGTPVTNGKVELKVLMG